MPAHEPLTSANAKELLRRFGPNAIAEKKPTSPVILFLNQFKSPLVYTLLGAAGVTFYLRDAVDTGVILAAVVINTVLGFVQEFKAQSALAALKTLLMPKTKVYRDKSLKTVPSAELVPGDIIRITNGDKVPADGTVIQAVNLFVNEAILTGESTLVAKSHEIGQNQVAMGTVVAGGRAKVLVTETGRATALGKIAETLKTTEEPETPLQHQLTELAKMLALLVLAISVIIFIIGIAAGQQFVTMFTTAVAVAVSAIPEGMVVSLTAILAIGMQRILKRKALVRKLVSAETLGSVTTICVDKTGTLTEGVMRVTKHKVVNDAEAIKVAVLANNLEDPIEIALWNWARNTNHTDPSKIVESMPRTQEIPFASEHKFMAATTGESMWIKGAPEVLLSMSHISEEKRKEWLETVTGYGKEGLRVIALAYKKVDPDKHIKEELTNLEFIGLVGVSDPVREGVRDALTLCRDAHIGIKVITGDFRATSEAVLAKLGLHVSDAGKQVMDGAELETISADELKEKVADVVLFYRVSPHHKLKIVEALQARGEVVAMTGDGVNDALALKKAEIAIVVSGAPDVARETADMVLLDSNFRTIVAAIEEGRSIFQNIRKVVLYLLSDAFSEMIIVVSSLVLGMPLPLSASQILWINIISDGFPNMALAFEPREHGLMSKHPRQRTTPIVDTEVKALIVIISLINSIFAMIAFVIALTASGDLVYARTLVFAIVGTDSLFYVFSSRSLEKPIWKTKFFSNPSLLVAVIAGFFLQVLPIYHPALNTIFDTEPLHIYDWIIVILLGLVVIAVIEAVKYYFVQYRKSRS